MGDPGHPQKAPLHVLGHRRHGSLDRPSPLLVPHGFAEKPPLIIVFFGIAGPAGAGLPSQCTAVSLPAVAALVCGPLCGRCGPLLVHVCARREPVCPAGCSAAATGMPRRQWGRPLSKGEGGRLQNVGFFFQTKGSNTPDTDGLGPCGYEEGAGAGEGRS